MTIFHIPADEVELTAVRSQGPGGQNVNKVSSAIQLRFDVGASSLPPELKERVLALRDHRLSKGGVVVIKSQEHRSQDMNRMAALQNLGFKPQVAADAVARAVEELSDGAGLNDLIRVALKRAAN